MDEFVAQVERLSLAAALMRRNSRLRSETKGVVHPGLDRKWRARIPCEAPTTPMRSSIEPAKVCPLRETACGHSACIEGASELSTVPDVPSDPPGANARCAGVDRYTRARIQMQANASAVNCSALAQDELRASESIAWRLLSPGKRGAGGSWRIPVLVRGGAAQRAGHRLVQRGVR